MRKKTTPFFVVEYDVIYVTAWIMKGPALKTAFYRGDHEKILVFFATQKKRTKIEDAPWIIGALSFLGKLEEAEALYESFKKGWKPRDQARALFFLGVGFCRHSFYRKGSHYFAKNLVLFRHSKDAEVEFYIFQGLSFFRYFQCRYPQAVRFSTKALQAANRASLLYGRMLATELNGYALVQAGEISRGLLQLKYSQKLGQTLGSRSWQEATKVSVLLFEAQFGLKPKTILSELEDVYESLSSENSFTRSSLLLELSRQLTLRGRFEDSENILNEACRIVYGMRHKRHGVLLNLRYGLIREMQNRPYDVLNLLRASRSDLDVKTDHQLLLAVMGYERKICNLLKIPIPEKDKVENVSKNFGNSIARRMLLREAGEKSLVVGQDPFGDLLDHVALEGNQALEAIADSGYFGLLSHFLPEPQGKTALYFQYLNGKVILRTNHRIDVKTASLSRQILRCLEILSKGSVSKEEFVELLWGYSYHPGRHDPLIYRLLSRLRKLIPLGGELVLVGERGYRLNPDIGLFFLGLQETEETKEKGRDLGVLAVQDLNFRQIQLLKKLKRNEFIGQREVQMMFDISPMTATRDLSELVAQGLVNRVGKARATRYCLVD